MSGLSGIWSRYRDNTPRHLIGIARDLQHQTMYHLGEVRGYPSLRPSLGPLLSLVATEPRSLGDLATLLAVSPQACSQLVNIGEAAGYVERRAAGADRRTRWVDLTTTGRRLVVDAVQIIGEVEDRYRALVGAESYLRLTHGLGSLYHGLDIQGHDDARVSAKSNRSIGVLPQISVRVQQNLMQATSARGHLGLKMSHAQVLPLIGTDGARVHQLARVQRLSRQAISSTARDLESLGYLYRVADPLDRRGVIFCLTDQGTALLEDSVASLDEIDDAFRKVLPGRALRSFQDVARELYQALHLEEEVFEARTARSPSDSKSSANKAIPSRETLEKLAASLRRELGTQGAERLAHLLE